MCFCRNRLKRAQISAVMIRETKISAFVAFKYVNCCRFSCPVRLCDSCGLQLSPAPGFLSFRVYFLKATTGFGGQHGSTYRGTGIILDFSTLFFHKINCGFRYLLQTCAIYLPSKAPSRGFECMKILADLE